jgi:hypothetical protein
LYLCGLVTRQVVTAAPGTAAQASLHPLEKIAFPASRTLRYGARSDWVGGGRKNDIDAVKMHRGGIPLPAEYRTVQAICK